MSQEFAVIFLIDYRLIVRGENDLDDVDAEASLKADVQVPCPACKVYVSFNEIYVGQILYRSKINVQYWVRLIRPITFQGEEYSFVRFCPSCGVFFQLTENNEKKLQNRALMFAEKYRREQGRLNQDEYQRSLAPQV